MTAPRPLRAVVDETDELMRMGFLGSFPTLPEWQRLCVACPGSRKTEVQGGRYGFYLHCVTVHPNDPISGGDAAV